MKLIHKVSSKFTHKFFVGRVQLLFEYLESLRGAEEFPFDNLRTVSRSRGNFAFKPARPCQNTLYECLVSQLECSQKAERRLTFTKSLRS